MRHHLFSIIFILLGIIALPNLRAEDQPGYVLGNGVVLRANHATYYESLAKLSENTPLKIVSRQGDWVEVRLPVRIKGWVQKDRIDEEGVVQDAICPISVFTGAKA
jgi:hypothetical protein